MSSNNLDIKNISVNDFVDINDINANFGKVNSAFDVVEITINPSEWTGISKPFIVNKEVVGMTDKGYPIATLSGTLAEIEEMESEVSLIKNTVTSLNNVQFQATEKPTKVIKLVLKGVY